MIISFRYLHYLDGRFAAFQIGNARVPLLDVNELDNRILNLPSLCKFHPEAPKAIDMHLKKAIELGRGKGTYCHASVTYDKNPWKNVNKVPRTQ